MGQLKHYKEKVRGILEDHPQARNNDGTLIAHYINIYHPHFVFEDINGHKSINLKHFKELPPFENLRRLRQIIQHDNEELQPTDPRVTKMRRIKEKNWNDAEVREAKMV